MWGEGRLDNEASHMAHIYDILAADKLAEPGVTIEWGW